MGFFQSAGCFIKWKSLYDYLIGRHTFYSFASPSPTAAPPRCWAWLVWSLLASNVLPSESLVFDSITCNVALYDGKRSGIWRENQRVIAFRNYNFDFCLIYSRPVLFVVCVCASGHSCTPKPVVWVPILFISPATQCVALRSVLRKLGDVIGIELTKKLPGWSCQ